MPGKKLADGIRAKYADALKPERYDFPRDGLLGHATRWYLTPDGPAKRPLLGIYSMAIFAEHLLHGARFGTRGRRVALGKASAFFASTRRAMESVLSNYGCRGRLGESEVANARKRVRELVKEANEVYGVMRRDTAKCVKCTACGGGRLVLSDALLLEEILYEQSRAGCIPPTSELFRKKLT